MNLAKEIQLQREYYARTAKSYDQAHLESGESHDLAMHILGAMADQYDFRSILDVGAGTGRVLRHLTRRFPDREIVGIEPVAEMRAIGHRHGILTRNLRAGDATHLEFPDGSFDVVTAFGVLHHVPRPSEVVAEMLRVSRFGIFISDANRFAQGDLLARRVKFWIHRLSLWPMLQLILTRGRGFHHSVGDGIFYSYSVFDNVAQIRTQCAQIHFINLAGDMNPNLVYSAAQIALLALKTPPPQGTTESGVSPPRDHVDHGP